MPEDLSLIPETYVVEGENQSQVVLALHYTAWCPPEKIKKHIKSLTTGY